uniref:Uncharacterized protein n=1 Tax=Rhizophora mucronata TaxID=61149 RepID=A0A2P2JP40_RHIMU
MRKNARHYTFKSICLRDVLPQCLK